MQPKAAGVSKKNKAKSRFSKLLGIFASWAQGGWLEADDTHSHIHIADDHIKS